jgi:sarcosine oxidase subunit gamma
MLDPDKPSATPAVPMAEASVRIIPGDRAARYSFRCRGELPAVVAGYRLDGRVNSCQITQQRMAVRLGPDEWLLAPAGPAANDMETQFAAEMGDRFYSLVDVSHGYSTTIVEGLRAARILNAGCPLDLAEAAFPVGFATRTHFGKSGIILLRSQLNRFEIESARSFTPYVRDLLSVSKDDIRD